MLFKPGSAFAKVHFCISEHTNPSACSNSLQLSLRQLMTTAQQQQHCLIFNVFLNLGCQGSLVGGCLLYFSYKKFVFFPQTMTNPKTNEEGALPMIDVKAAVAFYFLDSFSSNGASCRFGSDSLLISNCCVLVVFPLSLGKQSCSVYFNNYSRIIIHPVCRL